MSSKINGMSGWKKSISYYWSKDNLPMLIELACVICFIVFSVGLPKIFNARKRPIPYQVTSAGDVILDSSLNHEYEESETVPNLLNGLCSILIPMVIISSTAFLTGVKGDTHAAICMFSFAYASAELTTHLVKVYVGRLRPNFYEKCEFDASSFECASADGEEEARKSFPSGHSTLAFACMTALSLFFLGRAGSYKKNHTSYKHQAIRRLLSIVSILPMSFAVFVASSRVVDNWHHPADIVAGSVIGFTCAIFSYNLWYHPWNTELSGVPLSYNFDEMTCTRNNVELELSSAEAEHL